jgi:hypothetical protein
MHFTRGKNGYRWIFYFFFNKSNFSMTYAHINVKKTTPKQHYMIVHTNILELIEIFCSRTFGPNGPTRFFFFFFFH